MNGSLLPKHRLKQSMNRINIAKSLLLLGVLTSAACEMGSDEVPGTEISHIESSQTVVNGAASEDLTVFLENELPVGSTITFPEAKTNQEGDVTYPASVEIINAQRDAEVDGTIATVDLEYESAPVLNEVGNPIMHCDIMPGAPSRERGALYTSCLGFNSAKTRNFAEGIADQVLANSAVCEPLAAGVPAFCNAHGDLARSELNSGSGSLPPPSDIDICGYHTPTSFQGTRGSNTCGIWPVKWRTYKTRVIVRSSCGANCQ